MEYKLFSIIIPCYNEEKNIPFLIERIEKIIEKNKKIEVLLVDNGSTDNSKIILEEKLKETDKNIRMVHVSVNKGYGLGILAGLKEAKGDVLSWTHADLQTDVDDALNGLKIYNESSTEIFIKGKRKNRNKLDEIFTFGMQIIATILLKVKLNDINAQPKIFSRNFYDSIKKDAPLDFSIDLYFLYHAEKRRMVVDFPVFFNRRLYGEAKGGGSIKTKIKLIMRTFKYIFELKKKVEMLK